MRIGLIDVDGHNFPNLTLMRISSYHKKMGDEVEWYTPYGWYDIVYMRKVFSDAYTKDVPEPQNATHIIKGGTGYAIYLKDGKELFDKEKYGTVPDEVNKCFPDYSIYPEFDFAVALTSIGCPRGCHFCHVKDVNGRKSIKVADVSDFYAGQPKIEVLDPNITACKDKRDLFAQYREICVPRKGAEVNFNQGLDIRLIDSYDIEDINHMRIGVTGIHFAWDNPKDNLEPYFAEFAKGFRRKANNGTVCVLTNFDSTMEENLYRIYTLRDLKYRPYVMVYDKPNAPKEIRQLQQWCNNKIIFNKCEKFEDFRKK